MNQQRHTANYKHTHTHTHTQSYCQMHKTDGAPYTNVYITHFSKEREKQTASEHEERCKWDDVYYTDVARVL